MPEILMGAMPAKHARMGAYWRARRALANAGLLERAGDGMLELNLHNSGLDQVFKPNVRQVLLVLENFGPMYLRQVQRCLGYKSCKAVWNAVQRLKDASLVRTLDDHQLDLAKNANRVRSNPLDNVPQTEYKASLTDLARSLKWVCETAILAGDFAEGKGVLGKPAEILVLIVAEPWSSPEEVYKKLLNIASSIEQGNILIHYTIADLPTFVAFLNAKRGVWPNIFVKAAQGIVLQPFGHKGENLFDIVQRVLTYPDEKIQQLLGSGTLAKDKDGHLHFTDLGLKRYFRLNRPLRMVEVNAHIAFLHTPP
jgi:hypothetical protein